MPTPPSVPLVAIVGRPNVGKSTLFNRLLGRRVAIVADEAGTTRDRIAMPVLLDGRRVILVDTGGLRSEVDTSLEEQVRKQALLAIRDAEVIILVTDASTGVHPEDHAVADILRRQGKPVVLAVNKAEGPGRALQVGEFYALGLGEPIPVSALHNRGIGDLIERVLALLPEAPETPPEAEPVAKLAIVGRPNVGKSSMLNALVGEERAIVSPEPGTTRDALDTPATYKGLRLLLIDTAGIRRRGRIEPGIEQFAVLRALQAIERCDVAILVLDATEAVTAQDAHIAGYVVDAYKGLVVAVNKWDLARAQGATEAQALEAVRAGLHFVPYAPVLFTVASTGEGVQKVLEACLGVWRERQKRVPQEDLNRLLAEAVVRHPPPPHKGRPLHIYGLRQEGINPPTFVFTVNDPALVHFSYERYLANALRGVFGFAGTPLRLRFIARPQAKVGRS
ncbi:MAG: ribosome biogenesis GTPase Der [Dehalococcoidia bacterium]|nr:ribosome biogenesis GTPase Der [Dehalococcoidia bacterium]MDW8120482.1 ribosome biogenesis GTPase Der [Chloroflexota bacterium]